MKLKTKSAAAGALLALAILGTLTVPTAPAEAGWRSGTWRYGPYRHPNYGGALAAGAIGGLALGALAASARPAYACPGYGYPAYAPVTEVEECRVIVKRRYDEFGDLVVKRIRICD